MERSNEAWVAELAAGDAAALAALREELVRNLRRALAGKALRHEALVEDAAQDAMLRVLDRLDQFQGRSRFLTWATAIAIRVAFGQLRRRHWRDVSLDEAASLAFRTNGDDSPASNAARRDLYASLEHSIETHLTPRQRTALVAELRGVPQEAIAQRLGVSRNALYKLTHDARKKLKKRLEAAGFSSDDLAAAHGN